MLEQSWWSSNWPPHMELEFDEAALVLSCYKDNNHLSQLYSLQYIITKIRTYIMFNALNRFISRLDSDAPQQRSDHGAFGFQVLRNKTVELAVEPWFDFIVGINGRIIDDSDPALFAQEIRNCAGSTVTLGLWSAKAHS